jgi:hypothetical protein
VIIIIAKTAVVVPQQIGLRDRTLGKYSATSTRDSTSSCPSFDQIRYKHSLKESAVDVAETDLAPRATTSK